MNLTVNAMAMEKSKMKADVRASTSTENRLNTNHILMASVLGAPQVRSTVDSFHDDLFVDRHSLSDSHATRRQLYPVFLDRKLLHRIFR
jgi:hypothetical protein